MSRDNFPAVLIPHGNAASSGERLLQWIIYHSSAATRWQEAGVHTSEFILWKSFSLWNTVIYAFILCSCTFYFCNALRARKVVSNLKHSTSNFVCIWISGPNLPHWSCRNLQSLVRLITSGGFSEESPGSDTVEWCRLTFSKGHSGHFVNARQNYTFQSSVTYTVTETRYWFPVAVVGLVRL